MKGGASTVLIGVKWAPMSSSVFRLTIAAALALGLTGAWARGPATLFDAKSEVNGRVLVTEDRGVRTLTFSPGGAVQTEVKPGAPHELRLPYTRAAMVALALVPKPRRILLVGLGGGAMAMFLRGLFPEAQLDGVDIDPVVVSAAKKHLGLVTDDKLRAIVADGRKFTETSAGGYDLIFLDAYCDSDPPEHLLTVEFLSAVRGKLAAGGVAVGNVWGPDDNSRFPDVVRTWEAAFDTLCVLPVAGVTNTIFLARGDGQPPGRAGGSLAERAAAFARARPLSFSLESYARPGCRALPAGGQVIRDAR